MEAEQLVHPLSYYLRHKSNEDCLLKIFSYLNSVDLMHICDLDTDNDNFFSHLIKHHAIRKKLVCASSWMTDNSWQINKTLETFGGMIRRLKVQTSPNQFIDLIHSIMTNSSTDTLVELQIEIRGDVNSSNRLDISQSLLNEAIPYFRSLEVLKVHDNMKVNGLDRFVALVINNAVNLRSLSLNGVILYNLLELLTKSTYNLTELDLFHVDLLKKEPVERRSRIHGYHGYGNGSQYGCVLRYRYDDDYYDEYREAIEESRYNSRILNIFQKFSQVGFFCMQRGIVPCLFGDSDRIENVLSTNASGFIDMHSVSFYELFERH